jgi:hypothetical protein
MNHDRRPELGYLKEDYDPTKSFGEDKQRDNSDEAIEPRILHNMSVSADFELTTNRSMFPELINAVQDDEGLLLLVLDLMTAEDWQNYADDVISTKE